MKTKEVLNTRQYISCIVIFKTFICACLTSERETIIHGRRYPAVIVMISKYHHHVKMVFLRLIGRGIK